VYTDKPLRSYAADPERLTDGIEPLPENTHTKCLTAEWEEIDGKVGGSSPGRTGFSDGSFVCGGKTGGVIEGDTQQKNKFS